MKKQPPLFKRAFVEAKSQKAKNIQVAQMLYEKLWNQCNKMLQNSPEKTLALRSMQESCMWLCRAIAVDGWKDEDVTPVAASSEPVAPSPEPSEKPKPTVIFKTKKELDASLYGSMSLQLNDKAEKEAQEAHEKNMALITPLEPNLGEKAAQIEPNEILEDKPKKPNAKTTKTTKKVKK